MKRGAVWAVFVVAVLAQLALALNPGWFSHDELQWGAAADVARVRDLPWVGWFDLTPFQWRPLTFNGWLLVAHGLFALPVAWHTLWVVAGSAIAAALAALLLRLGAGDRAAAGGALVFALGPYATYVHGWAATLADLLVAAIGVALAHALVALRARNLGGPGVAALAFVATGVALLAKESAIAFAPLLALCWALWPRERVLGWATAGAAAAAAIYLAARLSILLSPAPADAGAYAIDPSLAPRHWLAYHLFVLRPSTFEIAGLWRASTGALALGAALWLALWALVARGDRRLALALVGGGTLLLAPVLAIAISANQYGYLFSLWTAAVVALAWAKLGRPGRALVLFFALATVWHGANVQREMRAAGERQAVFQPALAAALAAAPGPLRLYAEPGPVWQWSRLSHADVVWQGQRVGERVRWVDSRDGADFVVAADGSFAPLSP